jgi:hypothetical protein
MLLNDAHFSRRSPANVISSRIDLAGDSNELKFPYSKKAMSSGKNHVSKSFNFISIVKWGNVLFKIGKSP